MHIKINNEGSFAYIFDADLIGAPSGEFFSVDYWRSRQALTGQAPGRGSTWFIDAPFGPVVLREYLRGGWVARFSRRHYLFTGVSRSRPFREFRLLAQLHERGLPVPRPVAALCRHGGLLATGMLMTSCIPAARTLADSLPEHAEHAGPDFDLWKNVGASIRRFHDAGVRHADLNARNILLDSEHRVYLVDLDRARFTPGTPVDGRANLQRLKRSLLKFWPAPELPRLDFAWARLEAGYRG